MGGKMIIARRLLFPAIIAMLASPLVAQAADCTPQHTIRTIEPGTLTVAVTTYVPYSFLAPDGSMSGIDGEIAAEFARRECLAVKAIAVDPATAIQHVLSGKADIATGDWYRTAERAKVLSLSAPLYLDQMAIYSKTGVKTVAELEGKQVGTVYGYLWVSDLRAVLGTSLRLYPNAVNLQQDLAFGRLDASVDGYSTGIVAKQKGALRDITIAAAEPDPRVKATIRAAQGAFPYALDANEFGAALDAAIAGMHADGTIAGILQSYGLDRSAADTGEPRLDSAL